MYYYAKRLCAATKNETLRVDVLNELKETEYIFSVNELDSVVSAFWKGTCRRALLILYNHAGSNPATRSVE